MTTVPHPAQGPPRLLTAGHTTHWPCRATQKPAPAGSLPGIAPPRIVDEIQRPVRDSKALHRNTHAPASFASRLKKENRTLGSQRLASGLQDYTEIRICC